MTLPVVATAQSCSALRPGSAKQLGLLRHADPGLHGQFCGHSNPGLSAHGREQLPVVVEGLSAIFPSLNAIRSSDLQRAVETAEPIAKHFGLDYAISPGLREMNFGAWEGLTWSQVELQYPEYASAWIERFPHCQPPEGESFVEFQANAIRELLSLTECAEPGFTLIVTHAGFIRTTVAWVLGMPDERIPRIVLNHGAITVLENAGDHWSVLAMNLNLSHPTHIKRKCEGWS